MTKFLVIAAAFGFNFAIYAAFGRTFEVGEIAGAVATVTALYVGGQIGASQR